MFPQILAFGLISPGFLAAGGILVSVPIIIHILNRRRYKIVNWAAMEFLMRAMKKNRKRIRFEQLLLLATRCALLLLIGLALSRPLGCEESSIADLAGRRSGLHVFVINNGESMAYQADRPGAKTHLDQAKLIAKAMIEKLSSGGESVAIVTSSRPVTAVISTPVYDLKAAEAAIDRIPQSYSDSDEAGALAKAREIGQSETKQANKSLYLIDDSTRVLWQSSGDSIAQTAKELADIYKTGITHFNLGRPNQWNDGIVDLPQSQFLVTSWFDSDFTADVRGYGPTPTDPHITWKLDEDILAPGSSPVKAGPESAPVTMRLTPKTGGIHVITATLQSDDRLASDNTRSRVVDVVNQLKVLIVEGQRGVGGLGSSGAFLDTALNPPVTGGATDTGRKNSSYVSTERISDLELGNKVFTDYRCICLCGVGSIQETQAAQLEKFVQQGGTLMVFMGDPITAENYNATLYKHHLLPGPLTKRVSDEQTPHRFAFNPKAKPHPILDLFYGQENTGLDAAEIYSYWQVDIAPDSKVERVLDFLPPDGSKDERGDPAITVHSVGQGRVLYYATSADPNSEWTTFMAHQAYPALMHMLLLGTVNSGDRWMNLSVNDSLVVPAWIKLTTPPTLKDSSQKELPMEQGTDSDGQAVYRSSQPLSQPGLYTLTTGTENYRVAVNPPGDASDVRTIDDAAVKKALGDIDVRMEADSVPQETQQANQGKDLGWAVMAAVFVLLAIECTMAMRFGHHRKK